ncbi:hypothetical protein N431DRAFT_494791 [Stipitochalara longipes BDJ]|nr:hypothetical protein N431DRAFT_494791 [Stipitochalara longipes BDJ]
MFAPRHLKRIAVGIRCLGPHSKPATLQVSNFNSLTSRSDSEIPTPVYGLSRLEIRLDPTTAVRIGETLDAESLLGNTGYGSVVGVTTQPIRPRQYNTQEPADSCETTLPHNVEIAPSSSQPTIYVTTNQTRRSRQRHKRSNQTRPAKGHVYESFLQSRTQIQFARQPSGAGEHYLLQQRTSPQMVLGQGKIDPFDSFPIKMRPYTHSLIAYYTALCAFAFPKEVDGLTQIHTKWIPLSLFSIRLLSDCIRLLSEEIDNLKQEVSDMMFATIITMGLIEVTCMGDHARYLNHMRGLNEMVKIRGGMHKSNNRLGDYLKRKIIWANQLGGRFLASDAEEENPLAMSQQHQHLSYTSLLVLKSIRFLTISHETINTLPSDTTKNDYRATCSGVQNQLETLFPKFTVPSLEKYCIYAASAYVDLVLLHTPGKELIPSKLNADFRGLMMHSPQEPNENEDILRWISAPAAGSVSGGQAVNLKASLIDKFNRALEWLEACAVYDGIERGKM